MRDPLVLVPGIDGTGLMFHRQVPRLERRFAVTTVPHRDDARRMDELVGHLHAAVSAAAPGGRPVTLLGESFGGAVVLSYAIAHPSRVRRLVVLNSFPYFGPQARLRLGHFLLRAVPWGTMGLVRRISAGLMHSAHTSRAEIDRINELMRATTREGYLGRLRMLQDYDVRTDLPSITAPALFLAADGDHLVPSVEQARLMHRLTPGSTLQVLKGHGHSCLVAPDLDLSAILDAWIAATTARPA